MNNKFSVVLACSIVVNIFLVAFMAGRMTSPNAILATHFPPHGEDAMMMPPPPMDDMRGERHFHPPMDHDGHMPPPPFFGPSSLFSQEEMREGFVLMQQNFKKITDLRSDFAHKLKSETISKEEVLKHFNEIDQLMGEVRKQTQVKAAEKISAMPKEERQRFADRLLQEER